MDDGLDLLGVDSYISAPALDDVSAGKSIIKSGMKGESVKYVQGLVGVTADGEFGPKTEAAVKAFQAAHALAVDGVVGENTLRALDALAVDRSGVPSSASKVQAREAPPLPRSPARTALVPAGKPDFWQDPAWEGGPPRWKIGASAGCGLVGLFGILFAVAKGR